MYYILGTILNTEKYSAEAALREFSMTLMIYFILISYRISETGESKERSVHPGHNYLSKFCSFSMIMKQSSCSIIF